MDLTERILDVTGVKDDTSLQMLVFAMNSFQAYKFTNEQRIGSTTTASLHVTMEDVDITLTKQSVGLNWMACPHRCPSDDGTIREYQSDNKYIEPAPAPLPEARGGGRSRKRKARVATMDEDDQPDGFFDRGF